MKNLITP